MRVAPQKLADLKLRPHLAKVYAGWGAGPAPALRAPASSRTAVKRLMSTRTLTASESNVPARSEGGRKKTNCACDEGE